MSQQQAYGAIGAVVGGVIGFYAGGNVATGAQWGFMAGSALGGIVSAPNLHGPRLNDLAVQKSTEGAPIPLAFGAVRLAGNVLQCSEKHERAHTSSAKGGPKSTTYSYDVDVAIGLCVGPILGVRRIWANGKLIYDATATAPASSIIASGRGMSNIKIYTGSETQLPDPTLEAISGIGKTPAYRGMAYVVFTGFQLADFGNVVPSFSFEVIATGTQSAKRRLLAATLPHTWRTSLIDGLGLPTVYSIDDVVRVGVAGSIGGMTYIYDLDGNYLTSEPHTAEESQWPIGSYGTYPNDWYGVGRLYDGKPLYFDPYPVRKIIGAQPLLQTGGAYDVHLDATGGLPAGRQYLGSCLSSDGRYILTVTAPAGATTGGNNGDQWHITEWTGSAAVLHSQGTISTPVDFGVIAPSYKGDYYASSMEPNLEWVWTTLRNSGQLVLYKIAGGVMSVDTTFSQTTGGTGITPYSGTYPSVLASSGICVTISGNGLCVHTRIPSLEPTQVPLSGIVSTLCQRAGLQPADIDVTQLTDTVHGYAVGTQTSARAAIEPLRQARPFDVCEIDGQLLFVPRGAAPVAQIPWDDLAAHDTGDMPDPIAIGLADETELPTVVTVAFPCPQSDYQIASQSARRNRLSTSGQLWPIAPTSNVASIELAVGMTHAQAARVADVLLWDAFTARKSVKFSVGLKWASLKVSDPVQIIGPDASYTLRIVKIDEHGLLRNMEAVFDDGAIYQSAPSAAIPAAIPVQTVGLSGPTRLELMDIPLLRDADDGPGYYAAMGRYLPGWSGATLFSSADAGVTWGEVQSVANSATIGATTTALGNWLGGNTFDEANTVTVSLPSGLELASLTELAVLNGGNAALIGDEIIQFKTAALTAPRTYVLSGLLRGRRGTEDAMGTHTATDRFVLLSGVAGLARVAGAVGDVGLSRQYKPVTSGSSLDVTSTTTFTSNGRGLKPLAPVLINAGRDAGGNILIQWTRRTRTGGEWRDGVDASLGEAAESYSVDILSGAKVVRTLTSTTPTATYTTTQQQADFGVTPDTLSIKIYQVSAAIGRGLPGIVTLTLPPSAATIVSTPPSPGANQLAQQVLLGTCNSKFILSDWGWIASAYVARYHSSTDGTTYAQIGTDTPAPHFVGFYPLFATAGAAWCAWINSSSTGGNTLAIYGTDTTKPLARSSPLLGGKYPVALGSNGSTMIAITYPSPRAYKSTDGNTWTDSGPLGGELAGLNVDSLHAIGSLWLAVVGTRIYRTTDPNAATDWVTAIDVADYAYYPDYPIWGGVASGLAIFGSVALDAGGTRKLRIFESTDGITWANPVTQTVAASDRRWSGVDCGYLRGPYLLGTTTYLYDTLGKYLTRNAGGTWTTGGPVTGIPNLTYDGSNAPVPFRLAQAGSVLAVMATTDNGPKLYRSTNGTAFTAATALTYP